VQQR
jgi:hypothetical protein